jgi:VWFA-related protein
MVKPLATASARCHIRSLPLQVGLAFAFFANAPLIQAACVPVDSPNFTYHSTGAEVSLVFFATDERNHSLDELQKSDFAVVDNEQVIRDFRSFGRSTAGKLDLIVLIDSSDSVLPRFRRDMADVLQLISQRAWNQGDNVSVVSFSGVSARVICSGNCESVLPLEDAASWPTGGTTPLFDAIKTATSLLAQRRQPDVWPVILLFSDGLDTISLASIQEVKESLVASKARVYAIDTTAPGRIENGTAILRSLTDESGGLYVRLHNGAATALNEILNAIVEDSRSARVITYVPPDSDSDFHSIRILPTHNLKWQFRCRRGYVIRSGAVN